MNETLRSDGDSSVRYGIVGAVLIAIVLLVFLAIRFGNARGSVPAGLGVTDGRLAPCPSSPNCVSSDAREGDARVEPLPLGPDPSESWRAAERAIETIAGARIVERTDDYVRVECTSRLFGFVDDLELHRRPEGNEIAVRSASRIGYSDLGANRSRVEKLRQAYLELTSP